MTRSSSSTVPALRLPVDLKGGLSSGVKGAFEASDGLGERRRDLKETVEDVRRADSDALLMLACEFAV